MTRPIAPIVSPGLVPGAIANGRPEFEWIDPRKLLVDEVYQRQLSKDSISLIRKIVSGWDWARFKPPIVAATPDGYEVIDGQHTAIAAASHPAVDAIPVMVVAAPEMTDRAMAFVGHNRDRIALSQVQIHYASLAAGDEDAMTVQQVCDRAGVKLLRYPPGNGEFKAGESLGVVAIRSLVNRRGAMGARRVLEILANAHCAPVRSNGIKAVETLLFDPEYRGQVEADAITSEIMRLGPKLEIESKLFAAAHSVQIWRGMVVIIFKGARRGRRSAA